MMKWFWRTAPGLALALSLLLAPMPGIAGGPYSATGGNATLSVTGSSANIHLPADPAAFPVVQVINDGTAEVFAAIGGSSVTASTSTSQNANNTPIPAGTWTTFIASASNNYLAAIGAGSTTLRIIQWNGIPQAGVLAAAAAGGTSAAPSVVTGPTFTGNGSLGLTTASALISTMTPNSTGGALPTTLAMLTALNNGTSGDFAICPLGGTCTCPANAIAVTNGLTVKQGGGSYVFNLTGTAKTTPTIVACSGTPTAEFQW